MTGGKKERAVLETALFEPELVAPGNGAQLPWHEVIGRPRSGNRHVAVLEMPRGRAVTILIFGDGIGINEVGKINQDAAGIGTLADYVFFEWREELVDLHGERSSLGLPLP